MIAFGMIVRNEEVMLRKTLPHLPPSLKTRIALDTGSTDGTIDLLTAHGFTLARMAWRSDYSYARNQLLRLARQLGRNPWLLMLDADEAMFDADVQHVERQCAITTDDLITLPRYNLAKRGTLHMFDSYPDKQPRVVRLSAPVEFRNAVHEVACYAGREHNIAGEGRDYFVAQAHIYHYGLCKPPAESWRKSNAYLQIQRGEAVTSTVPDEIASITEDEFIRDLSRRHAFRPFNLPHPLQNDL